MSRSTGPRKRLVRPATQDEIAKRLGLDVSSVNKILNGKPGATFKKSTIDRVFRMAQELGYNLARLNKNVHHRNQDRSLVSIPTELQFMSHGNKVVAGAWGIIHDLSVEGLGIGWIKTREGQIPARQFSLRINAKKGVLRRVELRARVVRMLFDEEALFIGARFLQYDLTQQATDLILKVIAR